MFRQKNNCHIRTFLMYSGIHRKLLYMRNIILICTSLIVSSLAWCDIVPENSHAVSKKVRIVNTKEYPDICLLGCIYSPGQGNLMTIYEIDSKTNLYKGYKFDGFKVVAVQKFRLPIPKMNQEKWLEDSKPLTSIIWIDPYGGYVDNFDPVFSVDEEYKIAGITDTTLLIYRSKEVKKTINGTPVSYKLFRWNHGKTVVSKEKYFHPERDYRIHDFITALLLTISVELLVMILLLRKEIKSLQIRFARIIYVSVFASMATLPYVWFVFPQFLTPLYLYISVSELIVILVEAILISFFLKFNYTRAFKISLICNLVSFLVGIGIHFWKVMI